MKISMTLCKLSGKGFDSLPRNSRGFSLVQILIAIGLMSIISLGMATIMSSQNKEVSALDEKMALQGLQMQIMNVLSSSAFCKCFLGSSTFNIPSGAWNSFPTSISSSYDGSCAASGATLLAVGTNLDAKILPTAMSLQNIVETTPGSGNFSGKLVLEFDQNILTRSRKNLMVPMYFSVNLLAGTPAARPLASCSSTAAGGLDLATLCSQMNGFYNGTTCEPTYQ